MTRAAALAGVNVADIIDSKSACALTVTVRSVSYADTQNRNQSRETSQKHVGKVLLHPGFEIVRGKRAGATQVVWSNADLAAVFLDSPVPFELPLLELAQSEVQTGDLITMTGFSHGTTSNEYGVRYFGENRVNRLIELETGSAVFRVEEQRLSDGTPASHLQHGDSGGACIKTGDKKVLVGIATMGAEKPTGEHMSIFTSTYSHRA